MGDLAGPRWSCMPLWQGAPTPPPLAPPPPVTVNNNGKQVEAASSTPAGLELHPVLRCSVQRRSASPRSSSQKRKQEPRRPVGVPAGRDGGSGEPVDPLHLSDVTREQSRLNAASATPNC